MPCFTLLANASKKKGLNLRLLLLKLLLVLVQLLIILLKPLILHTKTPVATFVYMRYARSLLL